MTPRDEFVKMIDQEAERWVPEDDQRVPDLEELLVESFLSGPFNIATARIESLATVASSTELDTETIVSGLLGSMLKSRREGLGMTSTHIADEIGSDSVSVERIESSRANPSILSPLAVATWMHVLSVPLASAQAALLLALEHVNAQRLEDGATFARSARQSAGGTALSRTEAHDYFARVSSAAKRVEG